MLTANQALSRLKEGNQRFVSEHSNHNPSSLLSQRIETIDGQAPFAIVLGCADSRVPVEQVFDQGVGDLFVIRVAGNVVASEQTASIEFAAAKFGARLVVILGHSSCGAVAACIESIAQPTNSHTPDIQSLLSKIEPAVRSVMDKSIESSQSQLQELAIRANVMSGVAQLKQSSSLLRTMEQDSGLRIIGAEYSLESGAVCFFEESNVE